MTKWRRVVAGVAMAVAASTPLEVAPVTANAPPADREALRRAKAGLLWFLTENVDRPRNVIDPCPLLSQASVGAYLGMLELASSARPYGVQVVFDANVGGGVVAVRCGVDVAASADPAGSTALALDALVLDGQATFDQYAVRTFGRNVVVTEIGEPAGEVAGTCTNGGRSCTVALALFGMVLTVHLSGLPADSGEQLARELVVLVAPEVIANLGSVSAPT